MSCRWLIWLACGLLAVGLFALPARAQTISQPNSDQTTGPPEPGLGQSFTATRTGLVTQIQVQPAFTGTRTVYFFNGDGSGTNGSNDTAVYSQSVNLVSQPGFQTIVLDTPFPVVMGNTYAFAFDGNFTTLRIQASNPYPGGRMILGYYGDPNDSFDIAFRVTQVGNETISQPNSDQTTGPPEPGLGQSFTATRTGLVTQIEVQPAFTGTRTVYFFNGDGSGTNGSNDTAVYSQSVNLMPQPGFQTIVLNTPFPVVMGNTYAFAFDGNFTTLRIQASNPYPGGRMILGYNGDPGESFDVAFTVTEVTSVPAIPGLEGWALITLSAFLALLALAHLRRMASA
jgi:hypothetical protein